jgi:hypothetical protein
MSYWPLVTELILMEMVLLGKKEISAIMVVLV